MSPRIHVPVANPAPATGLPYQRGLEELRRSRTSRAVDTFIALYQASRTEEERGELLPVGDPRRCCCDGRPTRRWPIVTAALRQWPDSADLHYLAGRTQLALGLPFDVTGTVATMSLLGVGAQFAEWFADPVALLLSSLPTSAPA